MLDFMDIDQIHRCSVNKVVIKPRFNVTLEPQDLIVKNRKFYAIWDEEARIWKTDIEDAKRLIDKEIYKYISDNESGFPVGASIIIESAGDTSSHAFYDFLEYIRNAACGSVAELDQRIVFRSDDTNKGTLSSTRLDYDIKRESSKACTYYWDTLVGTILNKHDKDIFEQEIGKLLKVGVYANRDKERPFIIIDGKPSSGKTTLIRLIEMIFEGYCGRMTDESLLGNFRGSPIVMCYDDAGFYKLINSRCFMDILEHRFIREKIGTRWRSEFVRQYYGLPIIVNNSEWSAVHYCNACSLYIIKHGRILTTTRNLLYVEDYELAMQEIACELPNIAYKCMKKAL